MAFLYVTEYPTMATNANGVIQTAKEPETLTQKLAIGAGSVASSNFQAGTKIVRLHTDAVCSVLFGVNPTATAANRRLAANQTEFVDVTGLPNFAVAVITNT